MSVIHDLGYARYAGERRPPSTIWRVIMRQHLAFAWKTKWRLKPWLLGAAGISLVVGTLMYLQKNELVSALRSVGRPVSWIDGALPMSFDYFRIPAFMVTMTIGAAVIARDRESGAFTFYFARPVRPLDYVLGKLAGQLVLMAMIFLIGPVLLTIFRIAISESTREALDQLILVPKVLLVGTLATWMYAALPLAVSAVSSRRTIAFGLWAGYYIMVAKIVANVGALLWLPLKAFDPGSAVQSLAMRIFDMTVQGEKLAPMWAAIISLIVQPAIAVAIIVMMVTREAAGSVGGSG